MPVQQQLLAEVHSVDGSQSQASHLAEIAAQLAERGLLSLLAPVQRVAGYDTVMPLYRLESQYMPDVPRIVDAVRKTMEMA